MAAKSPKLERKFYLPYLQISVFVVAREGEPPARPDLADAEKQANGAEREEHQVAELPPLPDPQPQHDLVGAGAGARPLEEAEPEVLLVLMVVEAAAIGARVRGVGTGRLWRLGAWAPDAVASRGADLELDLADGAALERVSAAGHRAAAGDARVIGGGSAGARGEGSAGVRVPSGRRRRNGSG